VNDSETQNSIVNENGLQFLILQDVLITITTE